jgi:hypothetical protein
VLLQDAFEFAQSFLDKAVRPTHDVEIVIGRCKETDEGWEFGYNSRAFLEGGDIGASLIGNGPVVVPRDGSPPYVGSVFRR